VSTYARETVSKWIEPGILLHYKEISASSAVPVLFSALLMHSTLRVPLGRYYLRKLSGSTS